VAVRGIRPDSTRTACEPHQLQTMWFLRYHILPGYAGFLRLLFSFSVAFIGNALAKVWITSEKKNKGSHLDIQK
jgi:hypothetical protein